MIFVFTLLVGLYGFFEHFQPPTLKKDQTPREGDVVVLRSGEHELRRYLTFAEASGSEHFLRQ